MKYTSEVIIDLPVNKVIELFDNSDNMFKWQKGLQSFDHVSGTPGEEGAVSKLKFKTKKREMEMQETIMKKNLPESFNFLFEAKGVQNWNDNRFESISDGQTKWRQSNVFKGKGMIKVFMTIMPGMFRKQTLQYMNDFKTFAESSTN